MLVAALERRACWLAIAVILAASPACGPDGVTAPWLRGAPAASPYVVNRPAYADGARPFFISGYAGASYEPLRPGPRRLLGVPAPAPLPPQEPPPELPLQPPAGPPTVSVSPGSWATE
jgi:hypothetical protein